MTTPSDPIAYLRRLKAAGNHNDVVQMIRDRDTAIAEWGSVFSRPDRLTEEEFAAFLLFEHNRHWWGLQRRTEILTRWFDSVRSMIVDLLDEARRIEARIDSLGEPREFDHEVWSPILLVTHPETYGVWNSISESAMRRLGLWPDEAEGTSTGVTYRHVNETLLLVSDDVRTDLWTLDALWWAVEKEHDPTRHFVARRKVAPTRTTRTATPRARTATKPRPSGEDTFVCQSCWTTKPVRLGSDTAGICIDCA
ncbi:MAG: hypothetical protein WD990_01620 [Acidimicrobiia bacterium]